jgi:hypothetical protein
MNFGALFHCGKQMFTPSSPFQNCSDESGFAMTLTLAVNLKWNPGTEDAFLFFAKSTQIEEYVQNSFHLVATAGQIMG